MFQNQYQVFSTFTPFPAKQAVNAEHESQGALRAAHDFSPNSKPQVVGYRFIGDTTLDATQREHYEKSEELRKAFHIVNDEEAAATLWERIGRVKGKLKVRKQALIDDQPCWWQI